MAERHNLLPPGDWNLYLKWIDILPIAIVIHRKGYILYANQQALTLFHAQKPENLIGRKVFEHVHPDYRDIVKDRILKAYSIDSYLPRIEEKLIGVDGSIFDTEVVGIQILFRGDPAIAAFIWDITPLKTLEKKSREAEQLIRTYWDAMPLGVYYKDRQGVYQDVNTPYANLVGLPREEILGKTSREIWPEPYGDRFHQEDLETMATQHGNVIRQTYQTKEGKTITGFLHLTPVLGASREVIGSLGVFQETTEVDAVWASLEEEKERLATLIDATPDIICFKDGEGRWLLANKADLELFQLTNVSYKGKTDLELAKETLPIYRQAFQRCSTTDERAWRTGTLQRTEEAIPTVEGDTRLFDVYKIPLFHPDGSRKGLVVIGRDITHTRKMEEQLRESEETSRAILEALPDIIFTLNQEGQFLSCHAPDKYLFYHPPKDFIGKKAADVLPEELADSLISRLGRVISENKGETFSYSLSIGETLRHLECRMVPKGSREALAIIRDMTREKELAEKERAAQTELARLATVIQQSSQVIVITDQKGNIVYANPAFEKTTGYPIEEVMGKNPRIFQSGKHDKSFYKDLWDTITSGKTWEGTFTNKKKNGEIYYERAVIFPIRDEKGKITQYAAVKQDITREKILERQVFHAQKMEAIGTLAGGIAHDFNNLLNVMCGYCELGLQKLEKTNPGYRELSSILATTKKAGNLINQLLAFSRKQIAIPKLINVNEIVTTTSKMLQRLFPEDIKISLNLAPDLPLIEADPAQFEQILMNLVINARDAIQVSTRKAHEKMIIIETGMALADKAFVDEHYGARQRRHVTITVRDTGIGMDPKTMERIFEPFFTTKDVGKGTGLGLSTVFGIVKQNQGDITVHSKQNEGTTFKIFWPAAKDSSAKTAENVPPAFYIATSPSRGHETILFVEDVTELCGIVSEALKNLGYTVYTASNGIEALNLFREKGREIDLIVTDLVMPGMNGVELVERLKKEVPQLPILYTSGYTENHFNRDGFLGERVFFLKKPYTISQLSEKIREALNP